MKKMNFDYFNSLARISAARSKRSRSCITKRFFDTLRRENSEIPEFEMDRLLVSDHISDDLYSDRLLSEFGPHEVGHRRRAKKVTGNGNCLFNAASVALIGMSTCETR